MNADIENVSLEMLKINEKLHEINEEKWRFQDLIHASLSRMSEQKTELETQRNELETLEHNVKIVRKIVMQLKNDRIFLASKNRKLQNAANHLKSQIAECNEQCLMFKKQVANCRKLKYKKCLHLKSLNTIDDTL